MVDNLEYRRLDMYGLCAKFRPLIGYDRKDWTDENINMAIRLFYPSLDFFDRVMLTDRLEEIRDRLIK